jgi:hypothetical protein
MPWDEVIPAQFSSCGVTRGERSDMNKATRIVLFLTAAAFLGSIPARADPNDDLDSYRFRAEANWWLSQPSGNFGLSGSSNYFNLQQDFNFAGYSTFNARLDWRFKRKQHFLFTASPAISATRTVTLGRTIMFQGQQFDLGTQASAVLKSFDFAPAYQYDIIRRDHGFFGLVVEVNLLRTEGSIEGTGTMNGVTTFRSASRTYFAALPVVGPAFRWYPLRSSNRLSVEGSIRGMYFFGYGNFLDAYGNVNVGLTRHLALRAGYQLGNRLTVRPTKNDLAIQFTQKGPTVGLEYSWGQAPAGRP